MKLTFPRTAGFAAIGIGVLLALPGAANAGTATYTRDCGPNGTTIAHIHATNNWTEVRVNGVVIHDQNGDGTADLTTGPGVYSIEWWGPSTDGNQVKHPELPWIVISEHPTVLTISALTDCGPAATTTTTPPTTIVTATTVATGEPPTTTVFQTTACEQERDEGNDICNLGPRPPADASSTGGQLPATGSNTGEVLLIAGLITIGGLFAVWYVRYGPGRRPTASGA